MELRRTCVLTGKVQERKQLGRPRNKSHLDVPERNRMSGRGMD